MILLLVLGKGQEGGNPNQPELEFPVAFPECIKKNVNILTKRSQMRIII
jgi:hypothetical protein